MKPSSWLFERRLSDFGPQQGGARRWQPEQFQTGISLVKSASAPDNPR